MFINLMNCHSLIVHFLHTAKVSPFNPPSALCGLFPVIGILITMSYDLRFGHLPLRRFDLFLVVLSRRMGGEG